MVDTPILSPPDRTLVGLYITQMEELRRMFHACHRSVRGTLDPFCGNCGRRSYCHDIRQYFPFAHFHLTEASECINRMEVR